MINLKEKSFVHTRLSCRVCQGSLDPIISLGEQYISNFINPGGSDGKKAPLDLVLCKRCRLLQLKHTVSAELLYKNYYWYRSGINRTMQNALADIVRKAEAVIPLKSSDTVLDIGCNDGTLLSCYKRKGIYKVGFEPAQNLYQYSCKDADKVVVDFFNLENFRKTKELKARMPKIITSIAMFYDLENPAEFVSDIKAVMNPDGLWVIQMSYLVLMLKQNEFGNICHEHLQYYSFKSLEYLLKLYDFEVVDAELNDINGGSIRVYVRNRKARPAIFGNAAFRKLAAGRVEFIRDEEAKAGLDDLKVYKEFAFWIERIKDDIVGFIKHEVSRGKKVYVYGASTKGNTLLQYFGLNHRLITAAADRNPDKWGMLTVGTHIPIIPEEEARAAKPDYFLVLPWHFIEEFKSREKEFLKAGGKFIMPAPHFALI